MREACIAGPLVYLSTTLPRIHQQVPRPLEAQGGKQQNTQGLVHTRPDIRCSLWESVHCLSIMVSVYTYCLRNVTVVGRSELPRSQNCPWGSFSRTIAMWKRPCEIWTAGTSDLPTTLHPLGSLSRIC